MGKESLTSKHDEKQEGGKGKELLLDHLSELQHVKKYLKECIFKDVDPDKGILLLLINITIEKIHYYQIKYGFKIDSNDCFYIGDVVDFFRKAEELRISKKKGAP